ncbi:MAG: alpha/beta hydrolase [Bacteroidota bacterium]
MNFQQWKDSGQYFDYKGHQIFYQQTEGKAETLLLLHGFPTASWDWHKLWPQLAGRFQLIAPDYLGFGYSDKPRPYPYSILDQADMVETLLAQKGITKVHILAHDYGDTVLQELLARFIDRLDQSTKGLRLQSVVLLNGGIFPDAHQPRFIQKALISPLGFLLVPFLSKAMLRRNFHAIFGPDTPPSEQEIDEFYALMEYNKGKYIFHRLIRYMAERRQHRERWFHALAQCPVPLRLINGPEDPISGRLMIDYYYQHIPHPDVVELKGIGHYPQTEAPEQVLHHYFEFLQTLP